LLQIKVTPMSTLPRQRRKEARPAELLAAAFDLFVARGFAATRMEDIAQRAGVSKGTVFLYFESKQALLRAVVEDAVLPHLAAGEAMVEAASGESPEVVLRQLLLCFATALADSRLAGLPKLISAEAGNFPELAAYYHDNVVMRIRHLLVSVLDRGIAAGVFRPCDTTLVGRLAIAPILFECMWQRLPDPRGQEPPPSQEAFIQTHLDLFIRGLLVNPHSPRKAE
jgi:AcrR family transcriptional regulator